MDSKLSDQELEDLLRTAALLDRGAELAENPGAFFRHVLLAAAELQMRRGQGA